MAETAKKGKKKKGKTVALTEFLANDGESGPTVSHAAVFSARSTSWADESEGLNTEVDTSWPEDAYGGVSTEKKLRTAIDRAFLPTAPRASRGPDIDSSKIPDDPPFTAFLGNLSYDVDKDDILEFFANIKITEVRLPQDANGRLKGFGYAEFLDKKALLDALTLNNEHLKNRRIRVDVAGQQHQERERGDRDGRSNEPDRTDGDWRSKPVESSREQNGYYDRDRSYQYDDGPRDRWGHRGQDDGPHRDRSGYRGYDDGPRDRSGYRGYDDGSPRERYGHRGYDDGPGYGWDGPGYGRDGPGYSRDGPGYGRDRGYDDGPRGRDYGDGFRDRRADDYYGDRDRDRGRGFGSGWGHGDRDRPDDRGYDRYDDRGGGYGGRDRYDSRRYGDRRGGDRYESRGGYGRDRDRYDDRGRYGERDRYGDRDHNVDRYGDRDRRRDYDDGDRGFWRDSDRGRDTRSDFDRDEREPARERPKLQLKPRSKPAEGSNDSSAGSSSVFGSARPVDTAAKEREIEEKLARQKLEEESKIKQETEKPKERWDEFPRGAGGRSRRDSNRSNDGERGHRERRDSTDSRGNRDSARSGDETSSSKEGGTPTKESSREVSKQNKSTAKEVPKDAPPPAVNVWAKRMEQQKAASAGETGKSEPKSPTEEPKVRSPVQSDAPKTSSPPASPERKSFSKPTGARKFGGPPRGRGRGGRSDRGERSDRSSDSAADKSGGRGARKERKERKPAEPKKYDETPVPVFHTASKFSALLSDEDASEQDSDQIETEEQGET